MVANSAHAIPFGILIMRSFMLGLPPSIVEAARVDGAGLLRTFLSIVVPISRNSMVTVGLFTFLWAWGDFLFALTLTTKGDIKPVTLGHLQLPRRAHLELERRDGDRHARRPSRRSSCWSIAQRYIAAGATGGAVK